MTKAKNKITGILVALILILISALTLGGLQTKLANAQTETGEYTNKIYYFYDSDPYFKTALENDERDNVVYDGRYMASPQEFKYLLYTGYFWRFTNSTGVAVIIEIKSFELEQKVLDDLMYCLDQQNCGFMFISTKAKNDYYNVNSYCQCPPDAFSEFLKKPFNRYFYNNNCNQILNNTTFLLDGRLVGIDGNAGYNFMSLIRSPELRRLYNYFAFGFNEAYTAAFEEGLYANLWEYYYENYLKEINADCQDYLQITDIGVLVQIWKEKSKEYEEPYGNMWEDVSNEYVIFAEQTIVSYYFEDTYFFNEFESKNIHLISHADGDQYVDLLDFNEIDDAVEYTFESSLDLFNTIQPFGGEPLFVYAMARWEMKADFYDLIKEAQDAIREKPIGFIWNITKLHLFLWHDVPLIWGDDGVEVTDSSEKTSPTDEEVENFFNVLNELLASLPY